MKKLTNAIDTMLRVHNVSDAASLANSASSLHHWQERVPVNQEEQALQVVEHCLRTFGPEAMQELESHVEQLQEEFLAHLNTLLLEKNINLNEKLVLNLSNENVLVLQCQEQEEALLAILGENDVLHERLQELRAMALLAHGLQYAISARDAKAAANLAEYNVCVKGKLSHFYLR